MPFSAPSGHGARREDQGIREYTLSARSIVARLEECLHRPDGAASADQLLLGFRKRPIRDERPAVGIADDQGALRRQRLFEA